MPGTAAPKTFLENRDGHLKKAADFRAAARVRLSDNLPYRTAVSDAMESIRHALQAFLWTRVAAQFPRDPAGRWQEVAVKGSMPELLSAAAEAGLTLPSQQQQDIMKLVRARNSYTHDSPQSGMLITREVAEQAFAIATEVDRRVQGGKAGASTVAVPVSKSDVAATTSVSPAQVLGPSVKPPSNTASEKSARESGAAPATTIADVRSPTSDEASPATDGAPDDPDDSDGGSTGVLELTGRGRRRVWTALGIAAALVLGLLAGTAVTYPVASGRAALPQWVPFAAQLAPAAPTPLPTPTATPAYTGPVVMGNLLVSPAGCGTAQSELTLQNTGNTTIRWTAGSPDAPNVAFAVGASGTTHPTLSGQVAPGATVTLAVSGLPAGAQIVVITDTGAVQVALPAC